MPRLVRAGLLAGLLAPLLLPAPARAIENLWVSEGSYDLGEHVEFGWSFGVPSQAEAGVGPHVRLGGGTIARFEWQYMPGPAVAGGIWLTVYEAVWGDGQVGGGNDLDGPENGTFRTVVDDFFFPPGHHRIVVSDWAGEQDVEFDVLPAASGRRIAGQVLPAVEDGGGGGLPHVLVVAEVLGPEFDFDDPIGSFGVGGFTDGDGYFDIRLPAGAEEAIVTVTVPGDFLVNMEDYKGGMRGVPPVRQVVCGAGDAEDVELRYLETVGWVYVDLGECQARAVGGEIWRPVRVTLQPWYYNTSMSLLMDSGRWFPVPVGPGRINASETYPGYLPVEVPYENWGGESETPLRLTWASNVIPSSAVIEHYGGDGGEEAPLPWMSVDAWPELYSPDCGYVHSVTGTEADGSFSLPVGGPFWGWWACLHHDDLPEDYSDDCAYLTPGGKGNEEIRAYRNGEAPLHAPNVRAENGVYFDRVSWDEPEDPLFDITGYYIGGLWRCPVSEGKGYGFEFDILGWAPAGATELTLCAPEAREIYYTVISVGSSEEEEEQGSDRNEWDFVRSRGTCVAEPVVDWEEGRTLHFGSAEVMAGLRAVGNAGARDSHALLQPEPVVHWPLRAAPQRRNQGQEGAAQGAYTMTLPEGWNRPRGAAATPAAASGGAGGPVAPISSVRRMGGAADGRIRVEYALALRAEIAAEIYDVTGRRVASLGGGVRDAGSHVLEWDRRDAAGARVSGGMYFLSIRADGGRQTVKLPVR